MRRLFSTSEVHPRDRFDYWHAIACQQVVDHDCRPECQSSFAAEIEVGFLGDIELLVFENSPMEVSHSERHISRAKSDNLFVCRQLGGSLLLEQESRQVALRPGDVTLIDPALPYVGNFSGNSKLLVLKVPRCGLESRMGNTREMVTRRIGTRRGVDNFTSSHLERLPEDTDGISQTAEQMIATQTLDLISLSFAQFTQERPRISSARTLALLRLRAVIEARLTDPGLNPEQIAAAAGLSTRYANVLLSYQGTSVGRLIQTMRLSRCRSALDDPLQAHRTLSDIAYGWGFSDMTHFGRSFKKLYGMLPSEYRRQRSQPK